jgi:hypothetical protein
MMQSIDTIAKNVDWIILWLRHIVGDENKFVFAVDLVGVKISTLSATHTCSFLILKFNTTA